MKRIKTGITGLDELLEGGFPKGRSILVSGACGTGKTIFSMQFLYKGAKEYDEPGVFITLDERPELIREDVLRFGWDLRKLEQTGKLSILDASIARIGMPSDEKFSMPVTGFDLDKLLLEILRVCKKIGAERVALDSLPAIGFNYENENDTRKAILKIAYTLSRIGVTSILTSEIQEEENKFGKYGVEEYIVDGVIVLHYSSVGGGGTNRTIHIRKMRSTKHSEDLHPVSITDKGIVVHKLEEVFEE